MWAGDAGSGPGSWQGVDTHGMSVACVGTMAGMCPRPVPPPPRAAEEQTDSHVAVLDSPQGSPAEAWVTIVWDDPVNLMDYVTHVFCEYFGYPKSKSEKLMLKVHTEGRAVVSTGNREAMERDVLAMQNYTLWATMERQ